MATIDARAKALANAQRLRRLEETRTYLRSIAIDVAHKCLVRRKRSQAQVSNDYDKGSWSDELSARNWENHSTLQAYVDREWAKHRLTATIDGRLWRIDPAAYYPFRRAKLAEIIARYADERSPLYELGSGAGSIVFELSLERPWPGITGLELSPTGREVSRAIAKHYGVNNVEFGHIDLLDPSSEGYGRIEGQTVYTHYCLEQLPGKAKTIFRHLLAAGIERAILIEPTFELLGWGSLRDLASRTYVLRQDYQRTFVAAARKLEKEGLLKILACERLDFVSGHRHAATLLVFDNTAKG